MQQAVSEYFEKVGGTMDKTDLYSVLAEATKNSLDGRYRKEFRITTAKTI